MSSEVRPLRFPALPGWIWGKERQRAAIGARGQSAQHLTSRITPGMEVEESVNLCERLGLRSSQRDRGAGKS